jgi:hypothetical protein
MEENEFRNTYHSVNQLRCQFEKTILARRGGCSMANRFCIAEREGVGCKSKDAQQRCTLILKTMRDKACFALHITKIEGPLPHAKEIKVQTGGLLGLLTLVSNSDDIPETIDNIHTLIEYAIKHYGSIDNLPYNKMARAISKFEGRKKRGRKS